jgi:hypothetical protein
MEGTSEVASPLVDLRIGRPYVVVGEFGRIGRDLRTVSEVRLVSRELEAKFKDVGKCSDVLLRLEFDQSPDCCKCGLPVSICSSRDNVGARTILIMPCNKFRSA